MDALIWSVTGEYVPGTRYARRIEKVRREAIKRQENLGSLGCSQGELAEKQSYFERLGRRYGLLTEFRENAIC